MNILKLQELSRKRLEALSPEYLELRKRDTMEQELGEELKTLTQEIEDLKSREDFEHDYFEAIDRREVKKEKLEEKLENLENSSVSISYEADVEETEDNLESAIQCMETYGIIDLLKDENYREILKTNAENIDNKELADDYFMTNLQLVLNNTKFQMTDIVATNYDDEESYIAGVKEYISALFYIASIGVENYMKLQDKYKKAGNIVGNLNETAISGINMYQDICSTEYYPDNLGTELGRKFILSLLENDLYQEIDPMLAFALFQVDSDSLLETINGVKILKSPEKIWATFIKAENEDIKEEEDNKEVKNEEEETKDIKEYNLSTPDEDKLDLKDLDFIKNMANMDNSNLFYCFETYSNRVDSIKDTITDEEVEQIMSGSKNI